MTSTEDPRHIELVTTTERLLELDGAWTALWRSTSQPVFQSHGWIAAWWTTAPDRDRRRLRVVLAWRGEMLEAVLPLAICRRRGIRLLEWAAKDYTDYGDVLTAPGLPADIVPRMWDRLWASGGFDLAYHNHLLPDAAARALIPKGMAPDGSKLRGYHRKETSLRVVGAWPSGTAWFEEQSKKFRQNYRRGVKAAGETGTVRFRLVGESEPLEPILERLSAFKRQSQTGKSIGTRLFDVGSKTLPSLVRVLATLGVLRIFVLECDALVIAIAVNFVQADRMMAFVTAYDPGFKRGSPGAVLMVDYISWSFDQGFKTVDFLCGGEDFKRRFSTDHVSLDSAIAARTLLGKAALMADRYRRLIEGRRQRPVDRSRAALDVISDPA